MQSCVQDTRLTSSATFARKRDKLADHNNMQLDWSPIGAWMDIHVEIRERPISARTNKGRSQPAVVYRKGAWMGRVSWSICTVLAANDDTPAVSKAETHGIAVLGRSDVHSLDPTQSTFGAVHSCQWRAWSDAPAWLPAPPAAPRSQTLRCCVCRVNLALLGCWRLEETCRPVGLKEGTHQRCPFSRAA
jgi:hypothetical protein